MGKNKISEKDVSPSPSKGHQAWNLPKATKHWNLPLAAKLGSSLLPSFSF
jgi:hypothetical protein